MSKFPPLPKNTNTKEYQRSIDIKFYKSLIARNDVEERYKIEYKRKLKELL